MKSMLDRDLEAVSWGEPRERSWVIAWGAIAVAGAVVRLLLIDQLPLSESEASSAVPAWHAVLGQLNGSLADSGSPLLAHMMAGLFWLFGASDVAARLTPALAGIALVLTPALLSAAIGRRAALAAGLLIAFSPLAIETSRVADAAMITATLTMVVLFSLFRVLTDRPAWSPWILAVGIGLSLADDPGIVIAFGTALLAAAATWGASRAWIVRLTEARERGEWRALARPAAVAAGVAAVVATGAAMDLSGIGFVFGALWGGAIHILTPAPFPTRNFAAILVYAWPVLMLAAYGFVTRVSTGDRLVLFLGQWVILLLALSAVGGQSALVLAILPLAPAAVLAGLAVEDLVPAGLFNRLTGTMWGGALMLFLLVGGIILGVSQSAGAGHLPLPFAILGLMVLVAVIVGHWLWRIDGTERGPALVLFAILAVGALTIGSIGRLSFGGSPRGSELLPREMTDPAVRAAFHQLDILASADPSRVLMIDATTPQVVRWYGREISDAPREKTLAPRPFSIQTEAGDVGTGSLSSLGVRTPFTVESQMIRNDLNPLGIARWLVARVGLVQGRPSDIIISR